MQPVLAAAQIRAAEQAWFDIHPQGDLMGAAAESVAVHAREMTGPSGRVVVIAGRGNNAGDGLFAAADLATRGYPVDLWLPMGESHDGGLSAALECGARIVPTTHVSEALGACDLVIDALLGIGGRPGLPPQVASVAELISDLALAVLAVDLPSGLDADSSQAHPCIAATRTVTFIAPKLCHHAQPAASRCGDVRVVDLGVSIDQAPRLARVLTTADVARCWPVPGPTSDKYSRGVVGLDTGSAAYPGAATLGVLGAVYSGAGMVRFAGHSAAVESIRSLTPSVVIGPGRVQAWVCGSGWGSDPEAGPARLTARLADGVACVIDADALSHLPQQLPPNCLLTPHAGELARLRGVTRDQVNADPVGHARAAARDHGATVLLKGATHYAVAPDGDVLIAVPGPAWSAQAGSGDVLAGVAGTLLAAGLPAQVAGAFAASVQALAAARAPGPWPPDAVARGIAGLVGDLSL